MQNGNVGEPEVNPYLEKLQHDVLYHLGLSTADCDFGAKFGDVKFVVTGGSAPRLELFAHSLAGKLGQGKPVNLAGHGARFQLFKVGPTLIVDHGMGVPSMSIMMHEIIKLLRYADCTDVLFFRIGTSGGLNIKKGSLVITTEALNTQLRPYYKQCILGNNVEWLTTPVNSYAAKLHDLALSMKLSCSVVCGKTVCANDFYEEQGRMDGAFCSFTESHRLTYLQRAHAMGVRNFEMECTAFYAMCRRAGFDAAIVCVTLLNRIEGDQVKLSEEEYASFQQLPGCLVMEYIARAA